MILPFSFENRRRPGGSPGPSWVFRARAECYQFRDFSKIRETPGLLLREDRLAVDDDVEYAPRPGNQRCFEFEAASQLGRETRGPWLIVSNGAIGNRDLHRTLPCEFNGTSCGGTTINGIQDKP
jgi:hypothetical protein